MSDAGGLSAAAGLAAGTVQGSATRVERLDVVAGISAGRVDAQDLARLQRKVSGTEPIP